MVILITPSNRHHYRCELEAIFRLRHEVLVESLHWKGLMTDGRQERDQFDNDDALYLGLTDKAGAVIGCMRLNPATGATLTSTAFPSLVQFGDLPDGPGVYDVSRHIIANQRQASLRDNLSSFDLLCALYELGLAEGMSAFTAVMTTRLLSALLQIGVEVNAMGFPAAIDREDCVVVSAPVVPQSLDRLYRATRNRVPRLLPVQPFAVATAARAGGAVH